VYYFTYRFLRCLPWPGKEGHVPRPRNNILENKFSSVGCLAIRQLAEPLAFLTLNIRRLAESYTRSSQSIKNLEGYFIIKSLYKIIIAAPLKSLNR
jgi:hypothetical protein